MFRYDVAVAILFAASLGCGACSAGGGFGNGSDDWADDDDPWGDTGGGWQDGDSTGVDADADTAGSDSTGGPDVFAFSADGTTTGGDGTGGDTGADDTSDDDGENGGDDGATPDAEFTLDVPSVSDSVIVGRAAGTASLLGGEVRLEYGEGAFTDGLTLSVVREVIDFPNGDRVGYIWGRHGMPIGRAWLTITVPHAWIPPGDNPVLVITDGGIEGPLTTEVTETDEGHVRLKAHLPSLSTIVVHAE